MDDQLHCPRCFSPRYARELAAAAGRPSVESQRVAELGAVFHQLEQLRDQCVRYGHTAADFRRAAAELLDAGVGR